MKILCATDLTPKSDPAIDRAAMLAAQRNADLHLLHVVPNASSSRELEQRIGEVREQMKERIRPPLWRHGPVPHTALRIGSPVHMLMRYAEELRPDLIVLGPHEPRASRDVLTGTIAARLLVEQRCPVLIVRHPAHYPYRDVILALGLHRSSAAIIRAAEALVLRDDVRSSIVHSCYVPYTTIRDSFGISTEELAGYSGISTRQARDEVRRLVERESNGSIQYQVTVRRDPPAVAIDKAAKRMQPDLIVMGTRGQGLLRRALLGSVASRILKTATTDLLVVPEEGPAWPAGRWSRYGALPLGEKNVSENAL